MTTNVIKRSIRNTSLAIITSAAFMLPMLSWGAENCDRPNNDFDGLYCLTKVYLEADKELNNSYNKLSKLLNRQQKSTLKRGQLAWMRERNDRCSYNDDGGFFVNMSCATNKTTTRVNFLNERVRECNAGSCRDSRLDD
ncbi:MULTISPECIES: lysozyme inhibitor LprI family protein [unclassified Psychrobacter]|uniref:lysozyme inhibitor LprI family protein n=1 Tax=unclassified Psychrobacter TaxID=196806 RepID=UPI0025B4DC5C|nr:MULTISPECIES: lysozyme inhibitor LprI family protein [unclassified Psychrobacter]MDN3454248.1 lysozyme inhibitor LprI family protein [Psychrobacter sp. APC 3350]MDN3501319.1 lysozyme inhibitor LprI family protein [Psychrobacter sp. 5A.1]